MPNTVPKNPRQIKRLLVAITIAVFAILITVWLVITAVMPLLQGDGVGRYSGVKQELAKRFVEVTRLYNGPHRESTIPSSFYHVYIAEIRPVSEDEKKRFCPDPDFVFNDPNNLHYYAVTTIEGYLFSLDRTTTLHIGCSPDHWTYLGTFGPPRGFVPGPRVKP